MLEISEKVIAKGDASFIRQVAIPVIELLAPLRDQYPPLDEEMQLSHEGQPQAHVTELQAIIGISLFVASWAATKLLDELYFAKISPIIKSKLAGYLEEQNNRNKKYSITISILNKNKKHTILIACIGETIKEIENSELQISKVLNIASSNINENTNARVHLYVIDNGCCNLEPYTYETHEAAVNGLGSLYPVKPPGYRKNES